MPCYWIFCLSLKQICHSKYKPNFPEYVFLLISHYGVLNPTSPYHLVLYLRCFVWAIKLTHDLGTHHGGNLQKHVTAATRQAKAWCTSRFQPCITYKLRFIVYVIIIVWFRDVVNATIFWTRISCWVFNLSRCAWAAANVHSFFSSEVLDRRGWTRTCHGVPQNAVKAVEWFTKAAQKEHIEAQFLLGICFLEGFCVTKDRRKAMEWFTNAAEYLACLE